MLGTSKVLLKQLLLADNISDPLIMQQTVRECKTHNIAVGVHSDLPDIQGFGRRENKDVTCKAHSHDTIPGRHA